MVCILTEHGKWLRSGTGDRKERSVPDFSTKPDENRVQEKKKCDLYPILAQNRTKTGYRREKSAICTRAKHEK